MPALGPVSSQDPAIDREGANVIRSATPMQKDPAHWKLAGALTFFPVAAILHHTIFRPHSCILNLLGTDYYPSVVATWVRSDPSPWFALLAAVLLSVLASRGPGFRPWILAFLVAFSPLTIWLWDIPFTGGLVCRTLHDGRSELRSWHFYLLAAAAYFPLAYLFEGRRLGARNRATIGVDSMYPRRPVPYRIPGNDMPALPHNHPPGPA